MAEEGAVSSMESLIQELASSRLDAYSPLKRNHVIQEASKLINENEDDRQILALMQGELLAKKVMSLRRICTELY